MTTTRQARHSRFQRGSGVFTCQSCGRSTRVTTQDNDNLCAECYDLAGETNSLSDYGELYMGREAVIRILNQCVERGGSATKLIKEFPEVCEHLNWTGPITTPKADPIPAPTALPLFDVTATSELGLSFTGTVAAANAGEAIKELRAAVKLAGISRSVGVIHFRARKA